MSVAPFRTKPGTKFNPDFDVAFCSSTKAASLEVYSTSSLMRMGKQGISDDLLPKPVGSGASKLGGGNYLFLVSSRRRLDFFLGNSH